MIDLRNTIIKKEVPENENPNKIVDIVKNILEFIKQQKGKGLNISTSKQIIQRLPIALAQVKVGKTYEILLNEIRQIYILCIEQKELLKKYTTYNEFNKLIK